MVKPMKRREVNRALGRNDCAIKNDKGPTYHLGL